MAMGDVTDKAIARMPGPENVVRVTDFLAKKHVPPVCRHDRIVLDVNNRAVECKDCGKGIEPYEALIALADRTGAFQNRVDAMRKDHHNLAGFVPRLRAVRALEHLWGGKKLPLCPHCKKGVSAEAMAKMGWVNQRFAEAVEREKAEQAPPGDVVQLRGDSTDG